MSGRREAFVDALKMLEEAGINNEVTEKLRVEIAALDREADDEKVCHYFECMRPDPYEDWFELEDTTQQEWRDAYNDNKQYFTVAPEPEPPITVHGRDELDQWRQYEWKDRDGDIWDFRDGSWGYTKTGFWRSTTQSWLTYNSTYPMTRVGAEAV